MVLRVGMWNVGMADSLRTVWRELSRYVYDLVGLQEFRREGKGTEPLREYTFFYGKGNDSHELGTVFLCTRESH
jgi:hypothetical protein